MIYLWVLWRVEDNTAIRFQFKMFLHNICHCMNISVMVPLGGKVPTNKEIFRPNQGIFSLVRKNLPCNFARASSIFIDKLFIFVLLLTNNTPHIASENAS